MLEGLAKKKYLPSKKKRIDPIAFFIAIAGLANVAWAVMEKQSLAHLFDLRSLSVVVGGTIAVLLFQYDFKVVFQAFGLIAKSFVGSKGMDHHAINAGLDQAILQNLKLSDLASGNKLKGNIVNDAVYMYNKGLVIEEIDAFITNRLKTEFNVRIHVVSLLNRAASVAPALGLFGTVMGLMGVLRTLDNPSMIGPSMSLALMTTAYGAAMGSLIFTPLAGRIEHHNELVLEAYEEMLSKIGILIAREDRVLEVQDEDAI